MTDVVAALIWRGDRFLACQRPAHKARGLLWEFVGGKVEPGETLQQALIRECFEELAVKVKPGNVFMEVIHEYPDLKVRLTLFNARIVEGEPRMLEHNDLRWICTSQIDALDFCPADVDILAKLKNVENALQAELISLAEDRYKQFQCNLMPTVDPGRVLGVRVPALRRLAKELSLDERQTFLNSLPHGYYEEDLLHGILLNEEKNFSNLTEELERFLPWVDNWAVCDTLAPKIFSKNPDKVLPAVKRWLHSTHSYTVRFAIGVLMRYYLDENFDPALAQLVVNADREDYYVRMMIAWYFATALAKQACAILPYFEEPVLDKWVHNKSIQKAIESRRISAELKAYLKTKKLS